MSDVSRNTGSAELDRILAERDRIRQKWYGRRARASVAQLTHACRVPPIPKQPEKPLAERIAEAKRLRGQVSKVQFHFIMNAIYGSARDRGEYIVDEPLRTIPPEITAPGELTITNIQTAVAEHYNLTRDEMLAVRRERRVMLPRQIAMYLSKLLMSCTFSYIGERFGFDHGTVIHAIRKIEELVAADAAFADQVETLKRTLRT